MQRVCMVKNVFLICYKYGKVEKENSGFIRDDIKVLKQVADIQCGAV